MAANIRGLADVSFDRIACKIRQRNVSTAIGNHEYLPVLASSSLSGVAGQGAGPALAGGTRTLVGAGKLTVPNFSLPSVLTGEHPSRFHLQAVQDFFNYTEIQGKKFFDDLDEDRNGRLDVDDLRRAMRARNLPERYAHSFMSRAKRHPLARDIGWKEFKAVMREKEADMLRTFNGMTLTLGGSLRTKQIKGSLHKMGLEPTDENANAMIRYLGHKESGYISYGAFRNFLMLLPPEKDLNEADASLAWYEAATFVPLSPPVKKGTTGMKLAIAGLAGGMASGTSTACMHPLDTIKTQVQASVGKITLKEVGARWSELGAKGLYRGIFPATLGAVLAHGIRTATYEAVQSALSPLQDRIPTISDVQIQGFASGVGTLIGTAVRIPNEVLKQRLQCGQYSNVKAALGGVLKEEGARGLFRGTAATLGREVPFYVIGMVSYEQLKLLVHKLQGRHEGESLHAWETLVLGALSGGIAAALTTPADVLKTRTMTGAVPAGMAVSQALMMITKKEGPLALFKGALPRALWVSPLGAMNFAGYELARRAMDTEPGPSPDEEEIYVEEEAPTTILDR
eukprot:CAMPEP_0114246222 /NCGR_PEP_ID=MMETSP0058-20121206/12338_1 /TAXON_ID=36894 /ORGANISM="Pyramimonas parkeae, CCMP726" /LENGTH=568 /DNA_ID=CAMNT_0001359375 /DNA_START=363 /DNA_END=2069 /DNA_ORIENTATION=+